MLQLTRKAGERIVIGDDIEIVVMSVSRSEVRIGIQAPRTLPILRGEIADRVALENRGAAGKATQQLAAVKRLVQPKDGEP